ncbi:hypothetical protein [Nannocystis radixulma]|uniref:Lipoprotein n=1 Tax=Nannocystis radixulma TaxID=2995305 RepID=A0ABT5B597_9BACT|nr:hypothetical protein [Nannocystis radixulma]MDC0669305.1 hypothetical protein [Nannocystis radixulma]
MRRVVLAGVVLLAGCAARPSSDEATAVDATTDTETTGEASATEAVEPTTTSAPGGPHIPEGLFMCLDTELCVRWDCAGGCEEPGPEAMCVLSALYERTFGVVEVVRCDGDCALHRLIPRGLGTDDVRWQWRSQTNPPGYAEIVDCMLRPREFFESCLLTFTPECADPAAWVEDCSPSLEVCFD